MKNVHSAVAAVLAGWLVLATPTLGAQIVVAQVAPLTGLDATQGRAYGAGMQLLFAEVNQTGGSNGHTFKLLQKDDGGRPDDTVSVTQQMLDEHKPTVLAGYFGNLNVSRLIAEGLLEKNKIALVGYRSTEIRSETPRLYGVRAGLRDEINKLAEHLATIGINKLGLFYEDGPSAVGVQAAASEAANKTRAQIVSNASYPAGTASVAAAVDAFLRSKPQAIIMVSSGAAAAGFIEQYRGANGAAQLFAHSGADIEQMSKRLSEDQMRGVAIAQVTPSPYKISSRLTKDLLDLIAKADKLETPVSYAMMEGYIAAKVIVEAIRRQGSNPTREGMVAALDSMNSFDLGGYVVSYKPGVRGGSRFVELSIISGTGKIRQ